MNFLDYPDHLPDAKTIWYFRKRLSKTGRGIIIWNDLQRQMESKGIWVKKGSARDAMFITSVPGLEKHEEPYLKERLEDQGMGPLRKRIIRHSSATGAIP